MKITTIGIDLAKTIFQIHGVNDFGKVIIKKQLKRDQVLPFFANLPPCLIGMEACSGAHYWARKFMEYGHNVKLMAPQFVKPYVKTNKNDLNDAEAICEAVARPNMRFVPVKNTEQQSILAVHRAREGFVRSRTAHANQIRGLLSEYGIVIPQGIHHLPKRIPELLEEMADVLPTLFQHLIFKLLKHLNDLSIEIEELEKQIQLWHRQNLASQKIAEVPGIGPITATALVASIGDAKNFKNGRQLAAWLGLVPRQASSGGKQKLLGISKRGDGYLRKLLVHGARSVVSRCENKEGNLNQWLRDLRKKKHINIAIVAMANKNARVVWALLANNCEYQPNY